MSMSIPYPEYVDRILGGWIGKSIGGIIGAPVECHKLEMAFTEENCWPKELAPNDDLDIQVVWLEALLENGPFIDSDTLTAYWRDRCWYNFAEYGYFLYNAQRGIMPPYSGAFNNVYFRESMGCPIRSEIWGMVSPGCPELAAHYARMDGVLDHYGVSVDAEMMLAAAAAAAFFAMDIEECIEAGLSVIEEDSKLHIMTRNVQAKCAVEKDWRVVRRWILRHYGHRDCSKAITNQAITLAALFLGEGDFTKTVLTAMNCGWDSDCTAATAGALVGILQGASGLPGGLKDRLSPNLFCDVNVKMKNAPLTAFAEATARAGVEVTLARNPDVYIEDAPAVEIRGERYGVHLAVTYYDEPVLHARNTTEAAVAVINNSGEQREGVLSIAPPPGVRVSPTETRFILNAGETHEFPLAISRSDMDAPVMDKNLFTVVWRDDAETTERIFGLAGARQWTVYGPYWDIYDTRKHECCPYHNDELKANPFMVEGQGIVHSHQYVRMDRAYLDEAALLERALPEEDPASIERGEDHIGHEHTGGFAESCWYLTRDIEAPDDMPVAFLAGSTGPFVLYLNGQRMFEREDGFLTWMPRDLWIGVQLKKGRNRVVVKALRLTDNFRFSLSAIRPDAYSERLRGVADSCDLLGDWPE